MRIEDDDIIKILKADGPSSVSYVAYKLDQNNEYGRRRVSSKLRSLTRYRIVTRKALGKMFIYSIPGDNRPTCAEIPKEKTTARDKFEEYVDQIPEGSTVNSLDVCLMFDCRPKYARELITQNPKLKLARRRANGYNVWIKEA